MVAAFAELHENVEQLHLAHPPRPIHYINVLQQDLCVPGMGMTLVHVGRGLGFGFGTKVPTFILDLYPLGGGGGGGGGKSRH